MPGERRRQNRIPVPGKQHAHWRTGVQPRLRHSARTHSALYRCLHDSILARFAATRRQDVARQSDLVLSRCGPCYFNFKHLSTGVEATRQTDVMRLLVGTAIGALHDMPGIQLVVLAAKALPGTRNSLLW